VARDLGAYVCFEDEAGQTSAQWKARYAARAGVEGTMRQATHVTGIRLVSCQQRMRID